MIDGVKVLREYSENGLQNAFHILMDHPEKNIFEFLLKYNINPDQPDYDERTPFNILSKKL